MKTDLKKQRRSPYEAVLFAEEDHSMLARRGKEEAFFSLAARSLPALLFGMTGTGKTTALEHMILCDIERGDGVAVLDTHGDLSERVLRLLPGNRIYDVVHFDPGDPGFCPLWNPLKNVRDIDVTADAIVEAIKNASVGWGDRLEYLLRQVVLGILQLENPTLADIELALGVNDRAGKRLRKRILRAAKQARARKFWKHDIGTFREQDFAPCLHRFGKIFTHTTIEAMFHQPESRINFVRLMDEGMVFIVDLSKVGSEVRTMLGGLIFSLLRAAVLGRGAVPTDQCKPFHVYGDGAGCFLSGGADDFISGTRRHRVSLTLAFQHIGEIAERQALEAFAAVGSIIAFKVLRRDAVKLSEMFGVLTEDLVSLEIGEAVACTGSDILGMVIPPQHRSQDKDRRDRIIQMSRQRYCRPAEEVRADLRSRKPVTSSW